MSHFIMINLTAKFEKGPLDRGAQTIVWVVFNILGGAISRKRRKRELRSQLITNNSP